MTKAKALVANPPPAPRPRTVLRRFAIGLRANPLAMLASLAIALLTLAALLAPALAPHSPETISSAGSQRAPSVEHPLGTDENGRDLLSRLLYGGRVSMLVGLVSMLIALTLGTAIGGVAGYAGGAIERALMWLTDALLSVPVFFVLLIVVAVFGATLVNVVVGIGIVSWMSTARVVRGEVLRAKGQEFVLAARALGADHRRILVRYVLPQALPSMIVAATLGVAHAILMESSLSYLGVGIQEPTASWGLMLSKSQSYLWSAPLLALWPGLAILVTTLSYNYLGDALRDALDPHMTAH